jgi:hypothetical protein
MLLINHIRESDYSKVKAAVKLIPHFIDFTSRTVDQIVHQSAITLNRPVNNEELENIADLYHSDFIQKSSVFDFKLKIKK